MNRTNADFFKIYEYDFLEGRALTPQQVENKENVCVVSDVLAERLFGRGAEAVGRLVQTTEGNMRVVGVIRSGSQLAPDSYADIILPYAIGEGNYTTPYDGPFAVVATVRDNEHLQALNQELDDVWARFQSSQPNDAPNVYFGEGVKVKMTLAKNMETHPMHVLRVENNEDGIDKVTNWQLVKHYVGLLFVLLFVPALNLCGIVAGRMERRSAEMAVRKTFGARRTTLLNQVMMENLVLTGIGGIIGLALSWAAIYGMRTQILDMFFDNSTLSTAPIVEGEMLFAPTLFIGAFAAIMLLNLLAAVIPAWWSLRKPIVESMMEKR
jgi:putative ABC transport system permease protein